MKFFSIPPGIISKGENEPESLRSPALCPVLLKKSKTMTAITSGTYFSKFVIRKNPF
jgi:hypothetical protein